MNLKRYANLLNRELVAHAPDILTAFGICGFITTVVKTAEITSKSVKLLDKAKEKKGEDLTPKEVVSEVGVNYIPVIILGSASIGCVIGARRVDYKRYSALMAAYKLSETTMKDYHDKVVEVIGEKKEQSIRDEIAKEKIEKNPVEKTEIMSLGNGETLCYDVLSGRYFKSDIESIRRAVNDLNYRLLYEMYMPLNDFYEEIGLTEVKLGDLLGWNINEGQIDIDFSSQLATNGQPCLVLDYLVAPRYKYTEL